ncbi:ATP-grasp domain-containing protein [Paraburkholderia aspalathi]|uniref:ATP-grasp domain-containing protein n=1 Tax=Paraburkholderia aspalathi TaxID=1324617 RepID=UPI0038B8B547
MSLLCLARTIKFDYADWFADADEPLLAISSVQLPLQDRYRFVKRVADLDAGGVVELAALELAETEIISRVVSHSEYDLLRSARLRECLGLLGQGVESANAYRDKVVMKEYMVRAGVPVASFARCVSPVDLFDFANQHGFPLVIKPVDSSGSHDVSVIYRLEELRQAAADGNLSARPGSQMVESFVQGDMYHVNGLVSSLGEDFFAPCAYINGALDYQTGGLFGSRTIDPATPLARRLIAFTREVLAALPPADPLAFHAEIFHTPDDRLLLCEIAARTAGSLTIELIERGYGINLHREWARAQAGLIPRAARTLVPDVVAASLRVPSRDQRLLRLPISIPFPWVSTACVTGNVGQHHEKATTYTDDVLSAIVVGHSDGQLMDRVGEFSAWLGENIVWQS